MFGLTTRTFDTTDKSARTDRASVFLTISVAGSSPAPLFGLALTRDFFTNLLLDFQWERALLFFLFRHTHLLRSISVDSSGHSPSSASHNGKQTTPQQEETEAEEV